jgi:hypothetical protein
MVTDRTNQPVVGVHLANNTSIAHTPAYLVNNLAGLTAEASSGPNAGLEVFSKPVTGNVDIGVTHTGDLGGAA